MIFDVYELGGNRLDDPIAALRAGAVHGELIIARRFPGSPHDYSMTARVTEIATGRELLRPMYFVARIAMNRHSLMIEGKVAIAERESAKSKITKHTIRWLCKWPGAPAVMNPKLIKVQHEQLQRDLQSNGFHPAFDDAEEPTYGPLEE